MVNARGTTNDASATPLVSDQLEHLHQVVRD